MNVGLSEKQAEERLLEIGPNEPISTKKEALLVQIARRFASPLVAILVIASVISAAIGDLANAVIIWAVVLLSVAVEFTQTYRSQRAAEALKAGVAPTASVQRDGVWKEILRRDLVPGDLIRLSAGDMVPADAWLVQAKDLHVQEAALTGESLPVEKTASEGPANVEQAEHRVFMGSSVVSGFAQALLTETGPRTAFGQIAHTLVLRPPQTEFEIGIHKFGVFIMKTVLVLVLMLFAASSVMHRDPLQSVLFAVALAVGLTPEFLPMITTVTLAKGAVRMARSKVIVKNLAAIQNFGSIDILCSDKTGTLTRGDMALEQHVDIDGRSSDRPLLLAYVNSYFESGVENPVDEAVLRKARIDPLDSAVLRHEHPDISGYTKVDEVPFDFERRRVSVVAERPDGRLLVTKGAPEHVLSISTTYEDDRSVLPLTAEARTRAETTIAKLCGQGYRVLAVAHRPIVDEATFSKADEHDMILVGFLAFADPPREDAGDIVQALKREGVQVKVVTGDSDLVAKHVCARVGLDIVEVMLGADVEKLTDPALAQRAERTDIFARVSPAQKNRILRALKARGHVVGFLGDGINDAPSIHAADVGISVDSAVDVAKDAADIILLEPGLGTLLEGIVEGRRAFGNVMKYLLMGTSSNFGNMFSMAGAAMVLPFLPMLPTQILLNNFLYDLSQISIPTDNVDDSFVCKPRKWNIDLIRKFMLWIGPVSSLYDFLTFFVLLHFFHASARLFHTGWFVESLATQTLVIFVIRTMGSPLRSRPSRLLSLTTIAVVVIAVALPFTPMASWLGFESLPWIYLGYVALATVTYLVLVELVKRKVMRRAFV
jgi:Mg2+-importing ATPase